MLDCEAACFPKQYEDRGGYAGRHTLGITLRLQQRRLLLYGGLIGKGKSTLRLSLRTSRPTVVKQVGKNPQLIIAKGGDWEDGIPAII